MSRYRKTMLEALEEVRKESKQKPYISSSNGIWTVLDADGKEAYKSSNYTLAQAYFKKNFEKLKEEADHEVSMARGELEAIADKATQLASMLKGKSDEGNPLEAWVQSKITKAKDYINSVSDYLMYNPDMKQNEELQEARFEVEGRVDYKGISDGDDFSIVVDAPDEKAAEKKVEDMLFTHRNQGKLGPKGGRGVDDYEIESITRTSKSVTNKFSTYQTAEKDLDEAEDYGLKGTITDKQLQNIKSVWSNKTKKDITPGVKAMLAKLDTPTRLAIKSAKINVLSDLVEELEEQTWAQQSTQMFRIIATAAGYKRPSSGDGYQAIWDYRNGKGKFQGKGKKTIKQTQDWIYRNGYKLSTDYLKDILGEEVELEEGRKTFRSQSNIGQAKYVVNFHDGKKKHNDGSDFFDMKIFNNKIDRDKFIQSLKQQGYIEEATELEEGFSSSLKQKAKEIAKKFANNMTKAVDEIEKLAKGLSDEPEVYKVIRQYNEDTQRPEPSNPNPKELDEAQSHTVRYTDPLNKKRFAIPYKTHADAEKKMAQLKKDGVKEIEITMDTLKPGMKFKEFKEELEEGIMKDIYTMDKEGASADDIAKRLKINVNTVKKILGEQKEELPVKKDEKKESDDKQNQIASKDKEIESLRGQVSLLKQKVENEKNKAIKPEPNPKTGEVPLTIGIAHAEFKKQDEKKKEVKEESLNEKVADNIIKDLQKAYGDLKGKTISPEMAKKISKHLDQPIYDLDTLRQLQKANIPFISTLAKNKIYKKTGKFEEKRLHIESLVALKNKAEKTGMPYNILKQVYDRGMAAWKSGHRPGAGQQQWALARVNSFVTKSSGTWGGADKDLAAKVKGEK